MSRITELEGQYSEISEELHVWKGLTEHPGWVRLMKVASGQVLERDKLLRVPLLDANGVYTQEFSKGESAGIELFQRLPELEVERLTEERDRLTKEIENESTQSTDGGTTGGGSTAEHREPIDDSNDAFGSN